MCSPQRSNGFSMVNGSWYKIVMPGPRNDSMRRGASAITSSPRKRMTPLACTSRGNKRATALANIDLPLPDSPTIPTVSPADKLELDSGQDRATPTMTIVVLDAQVLHVEERNVGHHRHRPDATRDCHS